MEEAVRIENDVGGEQEASDNAECEIGGGREWEDHLGSRNEAEYDERDGQERVPGRDVVFGLLNARIWMS